MNEEGVAVGFETTIQGLSSKRAELLLELDGAQARVSEITLQRHHINVALGALGYDTDGHTTIREKFRGQNARLVMDVLEKAEGGLVSIEIARRVLRLRQLNAADDRLMALMRVRVNATLNYKKHKGLVVSEQGAGTLMVWRLSR